MSPLQRTLSSIESQLLLAAASGKTPSYGELADIVRAARESIAPPVRLGGDEVCAACEGTGQQVTHDPCPACEGTGVRTDSEDIPPVPT